jgi:hypothetical protein
MSVLQMLLPWLSQLLLLTVLLAVLTAKLAKQPATRWALLAILLVLGFTAPLAGSTAAQWLRSVLGDLSVLTLLVFAGITGRRLWNKALLAPATRAALLLSVAVVGVVFYPMALGVGPVDPYRLGFAPMAMVAVLCLTSLLAWLRGARALGVIILLPLLAYNLHLLESDNLWDYLLDPLLVIYALVQGAAVALERKMGNRRAG